MTTQEKTLMWFYLISAIGGIIISFYFIYKAKTKDDITEAVMWLIVSLTPAIMIPSILILMYGFICCITWLPIKLIMLAKNIKN